MLCLPVTESFSCQTTFISGSSEVMKCVIPFLMTLTVPPWVMLYEYYRVSSYISTQVYRYIHSNTPLRVRIRIHIRDRNSRTHLLVRIRVRISTKAFWVRTYDPGPTARGLLLTHTFFTGFPFSWLIKTLRLTCVSWIYDEVGEEKNAEMFWDWKSILYRRRPTRDAQGSLELSR